MRKLTVRIDDDEAEGFASFCATNGVSQQGVLASMIWAAVRVHEQHAGAGVTAWDGSQGRRWSGLVERARQIDAEKRRRG